MVIGELMIPVMNAALVTSLPPGGYTVQVSGVAGAVGEALIEVFEVQP